MTEAPAPEHCDHECVCGYFHKESAVAHRDGTPCMRNHEGCKSCVFDSRILPRTNFCSACIEGVVPRPSPAPAEAPPDPDKFCDYQDTCARTTSATCEYCDEAYSNKWKAHDATIRSQTLDDAINALSNTVYPSPTTIKSIIESLRSTTPQEAHRDD